MDLKWNIMINKRVNITHHFKQTVRKEAPIRVLSVSESGKPIFLQIFFLIEIFFLKIQSKVEACLSFPSWQYYQGDFL